MCVCVSNVFCFYALKLREYLHCQFGKKITQAKNVRQKRVEVYKLALMSEILWKKILNRLCAHKSRSKTLNLTIRFLSICAISTENSETIFLDCHLTAIVRRLLSQSMTYKIDCSFLHYYNCSRFLWHSHRSSSKHGSCWHNLIRLSVIYKNDERRHRA